jgi:HEAT repeats
MLADDVLPLPGLEGRIARVREELAALPERPEVRDVFGRLHALEQSGLKRQDQIAPRNELLRRLGHYGAENHRYRLLPPLPEEQVAAYEGRNQIRLPEDYRAFITQVANGGAGPTLYRLLPLRPDAVNSRPDRPFPFSPGTLPRRDWADDPALDPEPWPGAILLTDEGCTFYQLLVVTGPHRGRVVHIDTDCNDWPTFDPAPDFLTWYENWLFHRKDPIPKDPIPWGEHDALARIALAGEDGVEAEDAVRACFHLAAPYPKTQESAIEVLAAGLRGGAAAAGRVRAVWALGEMADRRSELAHVRQLIEPALRDPDPAVRAMAIEYTVAGVDRIRGFLDDDAPEVVGAALVQLAWNGDHHLDVLRRLLASPSATARIAAAEAGLWAYKEDEWRERPDIDALGSALGDLFLAMMGDPEPRVRAAAIVVLSAREPARGIPAFLAASHDPDGEVRFHAVEALRRSAGDDPEVEARLEVLAQHEPRT